MTKEINLFGKCLACHMDLEKKYFFCSITCACLAGYMDVKSGIKTKDSKELIGNIKLMKEFLDNPPLREHPKDKSRFL